MKIVALALSLFVSTAALALDGSWVRTYVGGYGHDLHPTADGGALLVGSFGAGFDCCHPWLVKLNPDGTVAWQYAYFGPGVSGANNLVPTRDGGYLLTVEGIDFIVMKVDADGRVLWAKDYGDGGYTFLRAIELDDGGFLLTGATQLEDPVANNGRAVRLDADGNVVWQKVYGRQGVIEFFSGATVGYDGNYVVSGSTRGDYWLLELDRDTGDIVWQYRYGGGLEDTGLAMAKVMKRYYLVVGASDSFANGGLRDFWAILVSPSGKLWKEFALGGADAEDPHVAMATSDGGFLIGGGAASFSAVYGDIWLVKFDSRARLEWQHTYGFPGRTDHAWHVEETPTGYAVVGDSYSYPVEYEVWLMTTDKEGNVENPACGVVGTPKVEVRATSASVFPAGGLAIDTKIPAVDVDVFAEEIPFPIESCGP